MKKIYKILPFVCLLPLFAGCGEKENTEDRAVVTFAPVDAPKSYMFSQGNNNYNCWSPNQEAELNINGTSRPLQINNNAGENVWVSLNNITALSGNKYRCFYPSDVYSTYHSDGDAIEFNVPKDLIYTTETVNGKTVQSIFPPMLGMATIAPNTTGYITLRHLGGLLEFRIKAAENLTGTLNSINLTSNIKISGKSIASVGAGAYNPSNDNESFDNINMSVEKAFNATDIAKVGDYMQIYIPFREFVEPNKSSYQQWYESQGWFLQFLIRLFGGAPASNALSSRNITITINASINGHEHTYTKTLGGSGNNVTRPSIAVNELVQMSKIQLTETQVLDETGAVMSGWTVQ